MSKDWKGNVGAPFLTIGTTHGKNNPDRDNRDYYATSPEAVTRFTGLSEFSSNIWECACGEGHLSKALIEMGYNVYSSDIEDRGFGDVMDFLTLETVPAEAKGFDILTNPPYAYLDEFVLKGLSLLEENARLGLFVPVRYLEGSKRAWIYQQHPLKEVWISSRRIVCAKNGDFNSTKGSPTAYAWFVWQKGYNGDSTIKWFNQ